MEIIFDGIKKVFQSQEVRIVSLKLSNDIIQIIIIQDDMPRDKKITILAEICAKLGDFFKYKIPEILISVVNDEGKIEPEVTITDRKLWIVTRNGLNIFYNHDQYEQFFFDTFSAQVPVGIARPKIKWEKDDIFNFWSSKKYSGWESEWPILTVSNYQKLEIQGDGILSGIFGYGINSYAFYWATIMGKRRRVLRSPYGGVYTDSTSARAKILGNLEVIEMVDKQFGPRIVEEHMIEDMDSLIWKFKLDNGISFYYGGATTVRLYRGEEIVKLVDLRAIAEYIPDSGNMTKISAVIHDIVATGLQL